MLRSEMDTKIREVFCRIISQVPTLQGRTYNIFDPVATRKLDFNVFVADSATGYCTCIPIERKNLEYINDSELGEIIRRVLSKLLETIQKHPIGPNVRPVDYTKTAMKAGRKTSVLDKTVNLTGDTRVHMYHWTSLIIPLKDTGYNRETGQELD